jgi:hypothetical protein
MKVRHTVLVALAAAVTLTSVAAAGPEAAKQRVSITATILPSGKAVLEPLKDGALKRDSGTFGGQWSPIPDRTVVRAGQTVEMWRRLVWTFAGKAGSLVFRERTELMDLGQDTNGDGQQDEIVIGTWKVVRGTGTYAGATGGGWSAHLSLGNRWVARYEGFLTLP